MMWQQLLGAVVAALVLIFIALMLDRKDRDRE
jgi:hypothetical protein